MIKFTKEKESKNELPFKIVDDILIGDEVPIDESVHIGDLILSAFKSRPFFVGQVDAKTRKKNTYKQMRHKSVKCALWLKQQDVKPGDIIVLCTHNQMDAYIPFFAAMYINAIMNPWNIQYNRSTIQYILSQITPKVMFVNNDKAAIIQEAVRKLDISTKIVIFGRAKGFQSLESILNEPFDNSEIENFTCTKLKSVKDTALIMFSSGTADLPKSIKVPYIIFISPSNQKVPPIFDGDTGLWFTSLSQITSVLLTVRCVLTYSTAIKHSIFYMETICLLINDYKVDWMSIETSMCNYFFKPEIFEPENPFEMHDYSCLKRILVSGSPVKSKEYKNIEILFPAASILIAYGMTETTTLSYQRYSIENRSTGYVAENVRLMFADLDTGKPVASSCLGEICCKCQTLMNGYYCENMTNPIDSEGWFHTGDIGYYDKDGNVFVFDKISHFIGSKDKYVSSLEIESFLQRHPAVLEAAAMSLPHPFDRQHSIIFVTKMLGAKMTKTELIKLLRDKFAYYYWRYVIFLKEMPRLFNGKIDRKLLYTNMNTYINESSIEDMEDIEKN